MDNEEILRIGGECPRANCIEVAGHAGPCSGDLIHLPTQVARLEGELANTQCPVHKRHWSVCALMAEQAEIDLPIVKAQNEAMAAALRDAKLTFQALEMVGGTIPAEMVKIIDAALSPDAGTKECERCRGTGVRHVAGEPTQEPCGECSGEGEVCAPHAGAGWVPPEVSLLLESLAGRWAFERFGYPDDTYPAAALELLADLDALGGT